MTGRQKVQIAQWLPIPSMATVLNTIGAGVIKFPAIRIPLPTDTQEYEQKYGDAPDRYVPVIAPSNSGVVITR